jgi:hypothetical protein
MLSINLMQALDPVLFAKEALSFTPDPWQEKALRWSGKRLLLNCSRQSGKSTTAAILAVFCFVNFQAGFAVVMGRAKCLPAFAVLSNTSQTGKDILQDGVHSISPRSRNASSICRHSSA